MVRHSIRVYITGRIQRVLTMQYWGSNLILRLMKRATLIVVAVGLAAAPLSLPTASAHGFPPAMGIARSVTLGSLTFLGVYPRIFTPNGDGANDKAAFHFDNPELLPIEGKVFDLSGAQVASMRPGSDVDSTLVWDGKDSDSRVVPAGIYLYQIEFQGKQATGTVVVAR
jgi:gliding motility-associated-like protein